MILKTVLYKEEEDLTIHLIYGIDSSINTTNIIYFLPVGLIRNSNSKESQKLLICENFLTTPAVLHLEHGSDIELNKATHILSIKEHIPLLGLKTSSLFGMAGFLTGILTNNENKSKNPHNTFLRFGTYLEIMNDIRNIKNEIEDKNSGDNLINECQDIILEILNKIKEENL
ncbi:polyprenyl synthetase family protein [Borrelia sp. P9F1]|uniref:polyprenyl synthetase family protein n=1 Tax=Borrelia sp. P9F1 TaxID=3058374 RepID=UPI0026476F45|nr:polyprenyl synthetase family protein [Borrelia sp. P9F1]WKC58419.1 polyprenyl synthetase family protein [Borrelia sp. P9F1]